MSVLECFCLDDITQIGCTPLYDVDTNKPVLFATPTGDVGQMVSQRHGVIVPIFFMPQTVVEDCAAQILVRAAISNRKKIPFSIKDARRTFDRRDISLRRILTHDDNPRIPKNLSIAVADPEFLGRYVICQQQRGLLLFNFGAVVGYQPGSKK